MSTCKGIEPSACRRYLFFVVYIAYWIVLIAMRRYRASFLTEDSFEECKKESFLLQSISSSFISDDLNGNGSDMQHMLRLAAVQHKLLASKAAALFLSPSIYLSLSVHFENIICKPRICWGCWRCAFERVLWQRTAAKPAAGDVARLRWQQCGHHLQFSSECLICWCCNSQPQAVIGKGEREVQH